MENKWKLKSKVQFERDAKNTPPMSSMARMYFIRDLWHNRALQAEADLITVLDEMQRELEWRQSLAANPTSLAASLQKPNQDRITTLKTLINKFI